LATDPVLGVQAVYVADANNARVQEFRTNGAFVTKLGTPGDPSKDGTFSYLRRVAVAADGDVWAADLWGWRLERFDRTLGGYAWAQTIGVPLPVSTDASVFQEPHEVSFAADGSLYVADTVHQRIVHMSADGHLLDVCGVRGPALGQFNWPQGVEVDLASGEIWAADTKQYRIEVLTPDCTGLLKIGGKGAALD